MLVFFNPGGTGDGVAGENPVDIAAVKGRGGWGVDGFLTGWSGLFGFEIARLVFAALFVGCVFVFIGIVLICLVFVGGVLIIDLQFQAHFGFIVGHPVLLLDPIHISPKLLTLVVLGIIPHIAVLVKHNDWIINLHNGQTPLLLVNRRIVLFVAGAFVSVSLGGKYCFVLADDMFGVREDLTVD